MCRSHAFILLMVSAKIDAVAVTGTIGKIQKTENKTFGTWVCA